MRKRGIGMLVKLKSWLVITLQVRVADSLVVVYSGIHKRSGQADLMFMSFNLLSTGT